MLEPVGFVQERRFYWDLLDIGRLDYWQGEQFLYKEIEDNRAKLDLKKILR